MSNLAPDKKTKILALHKENASSLNYAITYAIYRKNVNPSYFGP